MNNKLESQALWGVSGALGLVALSIGIFGLSGCTMNLPPTNEPIPTADPILLPEETATKGNSGSSSATSTNSKGQAKPIQAKPIEVAPSATTTAKPVTNQTGGNVKVINPPTNPLRQGQTFYIVKPKDTVFEVMRQTGVHWKQIIKLNNLKAPKYTIFPGQSLRIR